MSFYVKKIGKYFSIPLCILLCGCLESYYSSTSYRSSSVSDASPLVIQKVIIRKSYRNKGSKITTIYPGDTIVVYANEPVFNNSSYVELTVDSFGYVYDARYFAHPVKIVGLTSYQCQSVLPYRKISTYSASSRSYESSKYDTPIIKKNYYANDINTYEERRREERKKREQEESDERLAKQIAAQEYAQSQDRMHREELARKIASDEHIRAQQQEAERCKKRQEEQERERKRKKREQEESDERFAKQLAAEEYANAHKGMSDAEMASRINSGDHLQAQKQELKKYAH
jgi:hypothetical protein